MTRAVDVVLVVLRGEIARHREARFELHHFGRMRRGRNAIAHLREDGGEEGVMREVGPRDPREGFGGLRVFLGAVECAAEVIPKTLWVVGVEAHRLSDPVDAFLGPAQPGQKLALLYHHKVVIGIEGQRALLMICGAVVIVAGQIHRGQDAMNIAVVIVERQRKLQLGGHLLEGGVAIRAPAIDPCLAQHARPPGMGVRIVRIERKRAFEQGLCLGVGFPLRAVVQHLGSQDVLIGRHVVGPLALRPLVRGSLDAAGEGGNDRAGHFVLNGEDVLELAVIAFRPDVPVGLCVDQLHGDTDAIADLAHASLEHVFDVELAGNFLHLHRLALVHEGRVARDDEKVAETRQLGDDVLGEAVGKEFLLGIAAHVDQRQHRDGRLPGRDGRCGTVLAAHWRLGCFRLEAHPKDVDRAGDVFDVLVAEILKGNVVKPVADLIAHGTRDADAAGLGKHLKTRRDVDAVAEDVVLLDDDIAQIDADAELDPPRWRHIGIAPRHPALDLGGA